MHPLCFSVNCQVNSMGNTINPDILGCFRYGLEFTSFRYNIVL